MGSSNRGGRGCDARARAIGIVDPKNVVVPVLKAYRLTMRPFRVGAAGRCGGREHPP
ncbi:hypothetical protein ACQEU6_26185 [Spirillospora sp. CA-108201]